MPRPVSTASAAPARPAPQTRRRTRTCPSPGWRCSRAPNATGCCETSTRPRGCSPDGVPERLAAQAMRTPDAIAMISGAAELRYDDLERQVSRLAHRLRAYGAGPDTLVGVSLPRSPELRHRDSRGAPGGCGIPATGSPWSGRAACEHGRRRAAGAAHHAGRPLRPAAGHRCEDHRRQRRRRLDGRRSRRRLSTASPNPDLAYVLYTSGSTGLRGSRSNIARWPITCHGCRPPSPIGPGDRVLQRTPAGFDASVWEFLLPLLSGATLVLAPPADRVDAGELLTVVRRSGVTVMQVVPSLLAAMVDDPGLPECTSLRRIFCGGEPLPAELVRRRRRCRRRW